MTLKLSSPAFQHSGLIPEKYTCDGANMAPPLAWSNVPAGAKSLALIVDDPDAPDPEAPRGRAELALSRGRHRPCRQ